MKTLWTFIVSGGDALTVKYKGNPPMRHVGRMSVLKAICYPSEAEDIADQFRNVGARVKVVSHMETEDQKEERRNLLRTVHDPDNVTWNTERCHQCAWLDPDIEGQCGLGMSGGQKWTWSVIDMQTDNNDKFKEDREKCPLKSN